MRVLRLLGRTGAVAAASAVALGGAVAVYAAQPTPHGRPTPSPSPSVRSLPSPSPSATETPSPAQSPKPQASPEAADSGSTGHPCNHGWYVSQAAHKHAGGAYVSSVARSDLGKDGTCTAALPQP